MKEKLHLKAIITKNNLEDIIPHKLFITLYNSLTGSPYKKCNDDLKSIFIHIPKAAGMSVSKSIFEEQVGHKRAIYFREYDPVRFNNYFKFTIVRNPWDRLFSAYTFMKNGGMWFIDEMYGAKYFNEFNDFNEFVSFLGNKSFKARQILKWLHFRPQSFFVNDPSTGEALVNFVGKLESIQLDFDKVCSEIGIEKKLININKTKHSDYRDVYNSKSIDIVSNIYKEDIDNFNYDFEYCSGD